MGGLGTGTKTFLAGPRFPCRLADSRFPGIPHRGGLWPKVMAAEGQQRNNVPNEMGEMGGI